MGQAVEPPSLGRWHRLARAVAPPLYTDKWWNRLSGAVAPPLYTDRRWNRLAGAVAPPQSPDWSGSTACLGRWYRPYTSVNRLTQAVAPPLTTRTWELQI
ncbi:unnamed protein product [Musa textilis]